MIVARADGSRLTKQMSARKSESRDRGRSMLDGILNNADGKIVGGRKTNGKKAEFDRLSH